MPICIPLSPRQPPSFPPIPNRHASPLHFRPSQTEPTRGSLAPSRLYGGGYGTFSMTFGTSPTQGVGRSIGPLCVRRLPPGGAARKVGPRTGGPRGTRVGAVPRVGGGPRGRAARRGVAGVAVAGAWEEGQGGARQGARAQEAAVRWVGSLPPVAAPARVGSPLGGVPPGLRRISKVPSAASEAWDASPMGSIDTMKILKVFQALHGLVVRGSRSGGRGRRFEPRASFWSGSSHDEAARPRTALRPRAPAAEWDSSRDVGLVARL